MSMRIAYPLYISLQAMQQGAEHLAGTHDFRNLCKMDVANGVIAFERTIESAEVYVLATTSSLNGSGKIIFCD